ncbi:MAG TPA: hypothetical protein VEK08_07900 [Planctomycetota bacterium]|nr:hypothetical protein [Planctomycetota bacterium]
MGMATLNLYVGDAVRRIHPWDGSAKAGTPVGPLLWIKKIYPHEPYAMLELSDGKMEFECNIEKFEIFMNDEAA